MKKSTIGILVLGVFALLIGYYLFTSEYQPPLHDKERVQILTTNASDSAIFLSNGLMYNDADVRFLRPGDSLEFSYYRGKLITTRLVYMNPDY